MKRSFFQTFCLLVLATVGLAGRTTAQNTAELEKHPAVAVVREYLRCMLAQDWEKSAQLVDLASMATLRDDYVKRAKRSTTMSLDEEKAILDSFKVKRLEDIEKVEPRVFYVTYHKMLKDRHKVPQEVMDKVRASMSLKIISVGQEGDSLVHVLVRTKHNNDKASVESLELLSLVKVGAKWVVALNEQVPKITPLKDAPPKMEPAPPKPNGSNVPPEPKAEPASKPSPKPKTK